MTDEEFTNTLGMSVQGIFNRLLLIIFSMFQNRIHILQGPPY